MAFHISDISSERHPRSVPCPECIESAAFIVAHLALSICIIDISPDLHSLVDKGYLLSVIAEMLKDDNCIRICSLYPAAVSVKDIDPRLVFPAGRAFVTRSIGEALGEVKAESVHLIFLYEIF